MLIAALALAAFVAGLTGAWSPCGFSMVSTLGSHAGGRRTTLAACAAFVPGALAGGVLTFGALALLGSLLGGGSAALLAGATLAAAAAVAELGGVRIAPQVRRQVPEHWRRVLPLPLAAAGYGVLLGLGFTTFVLTFAVPALAGVSLAVGDPAAGLAIGLAFGAGRALPVVALAPVADARLGIGATELMAERPSILRGFRAADALALAAVALTLGTHDAAAATGTVADPGSDPSAAGSDLLWQVPGGPAVFRRDGTQIPFEARSAALGGPYVAAIVGEEIRVTDRATGAQVATLSAPGADKVAVSERWLAWRRGTAGGDTIIAAGIPLPGAPPPAAPRDIAGIPAPSQLGRPALDGDRLVFHVAGRASSRIEEVDLASGRRRTIRRARRASLTNPSLLGDRLLYVRTNTWSQSLVLERRGRRPRGRTLLRIAPLVRADKGYSTRHGPHRRVHHPRRPRRTGPAGTTTTLWSTALAADAAYVTRLRRRGETTSTAVLRVAR